MNILLANRDVELSFDSRTGSLTSLIDRQVGRSMVGEVSLAENWRLLVPLPERRHHYVSGASQSLTARTQDHESLTLSWLNIAGDEGPLDIDVVQEWRLDGPRVSVVTTITNRSDHQVEELLSPAVGGLTPPPDADKWRLHHGGPLGAGDEFPVFTDFPGTYLGPRHPVWVLPYHTRSGIPWVDFFSHESRRGLYVGIHDPVGAHAVFSLQLFPGSNYAGTTQKWPDPHILGPDAPIGMTAGWSSFPFLDPGGTYRSAPVVLQFHEGTWWEAARIFREWWDIHFSIAAPSWLAAEDAWQSTIISYPDGEIGYRYGDLVQLARDAKSAGINVIQICGWQEGGLDRGYPNYATDTRLGTEADFANALRECEEIGVKVLVFGNLQVANIETDEWPALKPYAIQDPRGEPFATVGWDYNTTTGIEQLSGFRMAWMNPAHEQFRKRWSTEMERIVGWGAAGVQLDKVLGGGFFGMDYNPKAPGNPATTLATGLQQAMSELYQKGRRERDDFCLAAESHWDRLPQFANASYARYFSAEHFPTFAAVFPEHRETCCVTGPHDFGLVNNAIRYGHIVSLEPECMHGSAADVPVLADYLRDVLALRRRLAPWIWDSRLVDPWTWETRSVEGNVLVAAHRSMSGRGDALVLNHFERTPQTVTVRMRDNADVNLSIHRLSRDVEHVAGETTVTVDADEVVVIVAEAES